MPNGVAKKSDPKPVWHNPKWVTAIVGVIGAFLTVPEVVSDYLSKQQDIELAVEKTREQSLKNANDNQSLEFSIVNNTLAQQGAERVFVLRYLARTLDDEDAKLWANEEVVRLEKLAQLEANLTTKTNEISAALQELARDTPTGEPPLENPALDILRQELDTQKAELQRLVREAGISSILPSPTQYGDTGREINRIIIAPVQSDNILNIKKFQISSLGFSDVGAHFLITSQGTIENGRSISKAPAVLSGSNENTIGIYINCPLWEELAGTIKCDLSNDQIFSLRKLISDLMAEFGIPIERVFDRGQISNRHLRTTILEELSSITGDSSQ
ncbi:hypothetical protein EBB79_08555 [Parasedimentitalea marina]|uniref:Uncharacterized protein n=1 Tax=Parasedimentitalea marina TaxID=2483033 RepID=A0A3T0N1S5_9RHOB|nr:N-acetylmuramoyl-L-alanine amidase [Parasedimentitalea marina]AZV77942.1 hypothetical protein EBB79_08555 [Parasedimentitalea marina]